jgi:hypothetical protein
VVPREGRELVERWNTELRDLGYRDPDEAVALQGTQAAWINRDAAADLVVSLLGAKASAWNEAEIRGKTEVLLAETCLIADPAVRIELAEISAALDAAQDKAASEIVGWVASHAATRVGPRGRQVQVPVEKIEAAVIRHYTSRAGDPHRHLHLQINARVYAAGGWRALHSVGLRDSMGPLTVTSTNLSNRPFLASVSTLIPATHCSSASPVILPACVTPSGVAASRSATPVPSPR